MITTSHDGFCKFSAQLFFFLSCQCLFSLRFQAFVFNFPVLLRVERNTFHKKKSLFNDQHKRNCVAVHFNFITNYCLHCVRSKKVFALNFFFCLFVMQKIISAVGTKIRQRNEVDSEKKNMNNVQLCWAIRFICVMQSETISIVDRKKNGKHSPGPSPDGTDNGKKNRNLNCTLYRWYLCFSTHPLCLLDTTQFISVRNCCRRKKREQKLSILFFSILNCTSGQKDSNAKCFLKLWMFLCNYTIPLSNNFQNRSFQRCCWNTHILSI